MSKDLKKPHSSTRTHRAVRLLGGLLLGLGASACGSGESPSSTPGGGPGITGGSFYFTDANSGGAATEIRLESVRFGRLVQLFGLDQTGVRVPMGNDFVVGQTLVSDEVDYLLDFNPVTGQENLTVLRDVTEREGLEEFILLVQQAGEGLDLIQVQDLNTSGVFSMLPRNSAVVLTFSDLLDPGTINRNTVQLVTGLPPSQPFESRLFPSQYYGGLGPGNQFYPTRVVLDLTISELEAFASNPPLVINGIGLPPSLVLNSANGQLRIPTRTYAAGGITQVLSNLTDHQLAVTNNGPVDLSTPTRPVTRAFRSGGRPDLISDPSNGFLRDEIPPVVVGSTPIDVPLAPIQIGGPESTLFRIPSIVFQSGLCSSPPQENDVIDQSGVFAQVATDAPPPVAGVVNDVVVQLLRYPSAWSGPGDWELFGAVPATYQTAFDPLGDAQRPQCYAQVLPQADGFPEDPGLGISTGARMTLRFSEPMDPLSLTAFDSLTLTRELIPEIGNLPTSDYVVGSVAQSADLRTVTFIPDQPLAHQEASSESYFLTLANSGDDFPPRDLAGNIVQTVPAVDLRVDPTQATQLTGGRVSRFTSIDEEPPFGNKPEWGGQFLVDSNRQLIRPRPIIRSFVSVDESQAIVQQMTQFPQGVVTPLSNYGSKMQTLWRYCDCGFSLTDPQNINIDVEGVNWQPAGGVITPDAFSQFEIRLSHCRYAPDEIIDPSSLFPQFQNSGLRPQYESNQLPGAANVTVHPRERGYVVDAGDLFVTPTGASLIPFPMNEGIDLEDYTYYTWRDTSIRDRAAISNGGVEPQAYLLALGIDAPLVPFYRPGQVQTVGLPLLMEFRTYPDPEAIGLNAWVLALAVNSSSRPYFRAFSTGGVNQSGTTVFIDPDSQSIANGGFNPGSLPNPGAPTFGRDNSVHLGGLDYVTRISQVHSLWYESIIPSEPSFTTRAYNPPTLEPAPNAQPPGTEIIPNFRGAQALTYDNSGLYRDDNDTDNGGQGNGIIDYTEDAFSLDLYGDFYNEVETTAIADSINHDTNAMNPGISFLGASDEWLSSVNDIAGARYYQVRLTFVGNPVTAQTPELSAFAITWSQN